MINCIFLSRDLPFTRLFDEVKDVIPWPGKRKTRAFVDEIPPSILIMMNPASGLIMPNWAEIFAALWIKYGHDFKQSASEYAAMQQTITFKISPFPVTKRKQQQSDQVGNQ